MKTSKIAAPSSPVPSFQFVALHSKKSPGMANIMHAGACVAVARSYNMGRRIANALNHYRPNHRGC